MKKQLLGAMIATSLIGGTTVPAFAQTLNNDASTKCAKKIMIENKCKDTLNNSKCGKRYSFTFGQANYNDCIQNIVNNCKPLYPNGNEGNTDNTTNNCPNNNVNNNGTSNDQNNNVENDNIVNDEENNVENDNIVNDEENNVGNDNIVNDQENNIENDNIVSDEDNNIGNDNIVNDEDNNIDNEDSIINDGQDQDNSVDGDINVVPPVNEEEEPSGDIVETPVEDNVNDKFMAQVEQAIYQKVNAERAKAGVPQLSYNSTMEKYARIKSQDMGDNNYFSHEDLNGNLITVKMKADGVSYKSWGENIAYIGGVSDANALAEQFMKNWMNSSGHRANILSTNFESIGVGVYKAGNRVYATQEFYR